MAVPFTKLFSSITTSTIWREDDHTRIIWITMLAMSDKNGKVIASVPGLADLARVPLAATVKALEKLAAPDKWSSSQEYEGRRIEKIDRGWKLLNHAKFRDLVEVEERREYMRAYMRDYRKQDVKDVNSCKPKLAKLAHTDTDTDTDTDKNKIKRVVHFVPPTQKEAESYFRKLGAEYFREEGIEFFDYYQSKGWVVGRSPMKDWQSAARRWHRTAKQNGTMWRNTNGEVPSKAEQRTQRNREALLDGFGLTPTVGSDGPSVQDRTPAGRSPRVVEGVRGREPGDA